MCCMLCNSPVDVHVLVSEYQHTCEQTSSRAGQWRPALEDYSLVYFLGGEAVAVQDLMFVMDTSPYEQ